MKVPELQTRCAYLVDHESCRHAAKADETSTKFSGSTESKKLSWQRSKNWPSDGDNKRGSRTNTEE